jgi:adenylylsulfate kinase
MAGEIPHFTGISDPYEPPPRPDLEVPTDAETVEASTARIVALLTGHGLIAPDA